MKRLRIIIVDDHPILAEGIASLLDGKGNGHDIVKVRTGSEAVCAVSSSTFDLAVVDLSLPDIDGMELIRSLRKSNSRLLIVVYTMHDEPWVMKELQLVKADAVVLKNDDMDELILAVESVCIGIPYYSARFKRLADDAQRVLTMREADILQYVSDGLQSNEIAKRLFVTENTIEYHRRKLMKRFGANNNASLVSMAIAKGLVKPRGRY